MEFTLLVRMSKSTELQVVGQVFNEHVRANLVFPWCRSDMTNIIEKALQAGKHVLVDDPVTTSVQDYCRLINLAHSQKKHLQDTTMFVYHHAVREFLTCILDEAMFGVIKKVDACFDIDSEGARFRGIASDEQRGCIDDLCRYCVVLGLLVFQRSRRKAISAQVTKVERDNQGFPMHCICRVKFQGVSDGTRRRTRCCAKWGTISNVRCLHRVHS